MQGPAGFVMVFLLGFFFMVYFLELLHVLLFVSIHFHITSFLCFVTIVVFVVVIIIVVVVVAVIVIMIIIIVIIVIAATVLCVCV